MKKEISHAKFLDQVRHAKLRIVFKSLRDACGQQYEKIIEIDLYSRVHPAKIFIHECLHFFYPDMSEKKVLYYEHWIWRKCTQVQRLELYKKLFKPQK